MLLEKLALLEAIQNLLSPGALKNLMKLLLNPSSILQISWPSTDSVNNANDYWVQWKNVFLNIVDKHAPCRTIRVRNKPSPWITSELKQLMYSRDRLKKKATQSNSPEEWDNYRRLKNKINKEVKRAKRTFYRKKF